MMKFSKVLLYLVDNGDQKIFGTVVELCKTFRSQLFVLFVVEDGRISKLASLTHEKIESVKQKIEEEGWEMLYLVEDEAVGQDVRTSLHLEDGLATRVMKKYIEAYSIDLVIVRKRDETKKIFATVQVPVIGL